ncbi:Fe-S cluster assembly protein SufD [Phenylobacterium sp.]|uniref:Fe-S cluster assembly protein SufD n=1 Tax=Phenylobacterium sp. TaxID=1871053 RepID=UPI002896A2A8|nr:Fe-S cluster assembly protein SufD [Phenylobacterium sp.]
MSVAQAITSGDASLLPSRRDEDWRWTDLRGLIRQMPAASPEGRPWAWESPLAGQAAVEVAVVNGRGSTDLEVAAGEERFVAWRFLSTAEAGAHNAELWVSVGEGAKLTLVESYEGAAGGYLANTMVNIKLAKGAKVERVVFAADHAEGVSVVDASVELAADAAYAQTVLTHGARRQRIETKVAHPGAHAQLRLDGAYLLEGQHNADLTTVVEHQGVDGTTTQLTKGVVRDQSRGVFQGRIVVAEGADRTDARMGHHALILSDKAEIDARPELLIFADDVQCAHGNTVGALDEDALFYAEQRGMPEDLARALLTAAFVGEVIDRIEHAAVREAAQAWADQRLEV